MTHAKEVRGGLGTGDTVDKRYKIEKILGRGGFAITYLARAGRYDKAYAIKEYLPMTLAIRAADGTVHPASDKDKDLFNRGLDDFVREGRRLLDCRHSSIVQVEDFFEERGTAYLVMEYVDGSTLSAHLAKNGPMSGPQVIEMLLPLLDALSVLHEKQMLHRDISPNNVMLRKDTLQPVLIDFGAARQTAAIRSYSIGQVCSDGYSPPEQYYTKGVQGPHSDIYALGCVAFRALTGARAPAAIDRMAEDDPVAGWSTRYPHVNAKLLVCVISKAIALNAQDRYQSVAEIRDDLIQIQSLTRQLEALRASDATRGIIAVENDNGTVTLSGTVDSREVADSLLSMLGSAAPGIPIIDELKIGATTKTAPMMTAPMMAANASPLEQARAVIGSMGAAWAMVSADNAQSSSLTLSGTAPDPASRDALLAALKQQMPGVAIQDKSEYATQKAASVAATANTVYAPAAGAGDPNATRIEPAVAAAAAGGGGAGANAGATASRSGGGWLGGHLGMVTVGLAVLIVASVAIYTYSGIGGRSPATAAVNTNDTAPPAQVYVQTPFKTPDSPFNCTVEMPKTEFKIGEAFTFTVTANEPSEFLVYTIDSEDKVELHDPKTASAFMGSATLEAGERRQIPVPGAPGRARIKGPPGTFNIGAVCGRGDLAKLGISEYSLRKPAAAGKRSFQFTMEEIWNRVDRNQLARASIAYTVEP